MKKLVRQALIKLRLKDLIPIFHIPAEICNYLNYLFYSSYGRMIKQDHKMIIFASYDGNKFADSPKVIYNKMLNDERFENYTFIWAFSNPSKFKIKRGAKVKLNSFKFYLLAQRAGLIISNTSLGDAFYYKGPETIHINTWHGTAIKVLGHDRKTPFNRWVFQGKRTVDYFCAQSDHDIEVYASAFKFPKEKVLKTGLPRNDELTEVTKKEIECIKNKLGIALDKKVILYAPTYRNYHVDYKENYLEKSLVNFEFWHKVLGDEYCVLFRAHYFIAKIQIEKIDGSFVKDVSGHPLVNDLLKVSDILITDYSSIAFDFSILERPILFYAYDYEEYIGKVGIYLDLQKDIPNDIIKTEENLLKKILNMDYHEQIQKTKLFKGKYLNYYGDATQKMLDFIIGKLSPEKEKTIS